MPKLRSRRKIYEDDGHAHFITFGCNGRRKLLNQDRCKRIVISRLEAVRSRYSGICFGFVIMPEHIHILARFKEEGALALFKQEWKRQSSIALVEYFSQTQNPVLKFITDENGHHRVWTPKQYDFNVYSHEKAIEKLKYMHDNPVRRELARKTSDWQFSSARWYEQGKSVGVALTHIDE